MKYGTSAPLLLILGLVPNGARAQVAPSGPPPVSEGREVRRLTKMPKLVVPVQPAFPPSAARSSTVTLALTIAVDGHVSAVAVLQSGGAEFEQAAIEAAGRLVFEPAEINDRPVTVRIKYTFEFTYVPPVPPPGAGPPEGTPAPPAPAAEGQPAPEVVVRAFKTRRDVFNVAVNAAEARKVVGTQGDPTKVVENLPGLARPSFGSGQLIVWGAAPGDTRTYVDGVEVPQLFHGAQLRATVNGDLVENVSLSPGAYGADYGRAIGGVVRVETRDLPATGGHGYLGADTLDGSVMLSASPSDRFRFAIAGRYGWLDQVMKGVDAPDVGDFFAIPRYQDYQLKAQLALRERESIDLALLGSADDLTRVIRDVDPAHARSASTSQAFQRLYLHYRHQTEDGATVEVVPWIGHDTSHLDARFGANPAELDERTWRLGLRAFHRSRVARQAALTMGVDVAGHHARMLREGSLNIPPREGDVAVFGQPPGDDTNTDSWSAHVVDVAPYALLDLDFGLLTVAPGLRVDGYLLEASRQTPRVGQTPALGISQLDVEVQPRVAARVRVAPRLALLAAAGLYTQPPASEDLSAVFGTPSLGPESAIHASVGESLLLSTTLSAEVVGFYKWMSHLAVRELSPTPRLAHALLEEGVGRSYGMQVLLRQRPWHGLFGWIAYTISRSERRDTPESNWRLFDFDQPHVLTMVASKEVGAWTLGLRFRYARGLPRTPVVGAFYDTKDDAYQPIFGPQNSIRLPDFWQLDVRLDRTFPLDAGGARLLVYLEALNVTNRTNGEEYVYSVDYRRRGTITGLPVIGVVGLRVEL